MLHRFRSSLSSQNSQLMQQVLSSKQLEFDSEHDNIKDCFKDLLAMI